MKRFNLFHLFFSVDKPDRLTINPEPDQDEYNKTTVREGGTVGPFNCSADCNPPCNITWKLKSFGLFREHPLKDGLLLLQPVKREMELLQCVARWVYNDAQIKESIKLDVQCNYLFVYIYLYLSI